MEPWLIWTIVGGVILLLLILFFAAGYIKAPTDTALIITGLRGRRILHGKAGFRIPFLERVDKMSLSLITIDVKTKSPVPTKEFINVTVDSVANIKISSDPEMLKKASESLLNKPENEVREQVIQVLEGNIREIVGASELKEMVQDRKGIADKVIANVVPDMAKLGIELVNFNIQNFTDSEDAIYNLGIDNITKISKDAAIAKAESKAAIAIKEAEAEQSANDAKVKSQLAIVEQNTKYNLKAAELKREADSAKAIADSAYAIEQQKKQEEINIATVNAEIAQKQREVELKQREAEVKERELEAEVNKKADAEKYAAEKAAEAELYSRQKRAEAELIEAQRQAEKAKVKAEADKVARQQAAEAEALEAEANKRARAHAAEAEIIEADAKKQAALAEAEAIRAKGEAKAEAISKEAEAMKEYGEAAKLKMLLESGALPEIIRAQTEPLAAAYSKVGNITMFGSDCQGKLAGGVAGDIKSINEALEQSTGVSVNSLLAALLGGKVLASTLKDDNSNEGK